MMKMHVGRCATARAAMLSSLLVAATVLVPAAHAQRGHGERAGQGHAQSRGQGQAHRGAAPHWRGDIARFHEHDWGVWRGGHWSHARHGGRLGWWWVVGPAWYYYPAPVYPYPSPWEPSDMAAAGPPPAQFWYYCDAARNYYPYVLVCPGGWRPVPATPDANVPPPRSEVP